MIDFQSTKHGEENFRQFAWKITTADNWDTINCHTAGQVTSNTISAKNHDN